MTRSIVTARLAFGLTLLVGCHAAADPVALDACIRSALERAPAVRGAAIDVDAATWRVRAAQAAYTPRLLAQGEYGKAYGFDEAVTNGGSTAALLTLEARLWDGGARAAEIGTAQARLHSATTFEQQRRADIVEATRRAYLGALEARIESEIHEKSVRLLRDTESLLQRQEQLGFVPGNDVLRARIAVDAANIAQRGAGIELQRSLHLLEVLSGAPIQLDQLTDPPALSPPDADEANVEASPPVADARAALELAQHQVDAARSERRPSVGLSASAGALGVAPRSTFEEHGGAQVLLGVSMPLFDGGVVSARIAAAEAVASSAAASLQQARQSVRVALADARLDATRAKADHEAWLRTVPTAEENLVLMRARYFGGGNVRLLEVIDALTQSVEAHLNVARAHLAYDLSIASQAQILGKEAP